MRNKKLNDVLEHLKDIIDVSLQNENNTIEEHIPKKEDELLQTNYTPTKIYLVKIFMVAAGSSKEKYIFASFSIPEIEKYIKLYEKSIKESLPQNYKFEDVYVCDHFSNILYEIDSLPIIG